MDVSENRVKMVEEREDLVGVCWIGQRNWYDESDATVDTTKFWDALKTRWILTPLT